MCRTRTVTYVRISQLLALIATWLMEVTMTSRWELEYHTTLMTLLRLTRNLRSMDCEHCADLLTQARISAFGMNIRHTKDTASNAGLAADKAASSLSLA